MYLQTVFNFRVSAIRLVANGLNYTGIVQIHWKNTFRFLLK